MLIFAFGINAGANDCECKPGEKCPPPKCTKEECFNIICHYKSHNEKNDGYEKCQVAARFLKNVTLEGGEVEDSSEQPKDHHGNGPREGEPPNNEGPHRDFFDHQFEVKCDGHLIYNDGARRFTDMLGTRIQAETGPYPAILLPRGTLHAGHHYAPSWLELGEQNMRGSCYIYNGQP